MNDSMKYIIIALLVLGLGGVLYFIGDESDDADGNKVEAIDWNKTYNHDSKHPYGTFFMRKILEVGLDGHEVINIDVAVQDYFKYDSLQLEETNITYMFKILMVIIFNNKKLIYWEMGNFSSTILIIGILVDSF